MIDIRFTLTEEDFIAAHRARYARHRAKAHNVLFGWLIAAALPLAVWLAVSFGMHFTLMAVIVLNLYHWLLDWPIARWLARRQFAGIDERALRQRWRIDAAAVHIESDDGGSATFPWPEVREVLAAQDGWLFSFGPRHHLWLPAHALNDTQKARLTRLLAEKGFSG
ncbi:MAG TPA: YcxB family protein [Thermopetrobacter sp.]|nr:YcxB family protein [Thermopetrobacter sp.]